MPVPRNPVPISPAQPSPVRRIEWPVLISAVLLVAGVIAAYGRTFSVPLLFDDRAAIVDNPTIQRWATAFWPPSDTTATGRPVLNLSLAFNYALSGTAAGSYHALNLAIHALAGLTLFGIIRRTLARRTDPAASALALAVALLWTLHPLQTEAVTYVIQRAESLMGLFYLLTLYCFIRGVEADGRPRRWFALSIAACLLGVATKEVTASAPVIVLLYDRTFAAGSFREAWRRRRGLYLGLAATWLPLAGLVAGAGWNRNGMVGFDVGIAPWTYWLTQFEAVTRYLWLSVWPHPLVFEYSTAWVFRPSEVILYALLVTGLAVAVLVALWRRPVPGFLGACFFAVLAPTSVMPSRIQMIVEHRMYLALAAVVALGVIGIHAVLKSRSWLVFGALALGLGTLTARRNDDYRSEQRIWEDTVAKRPGNAVAHFNLGNVWLDAPGHLDDAIAQYEEALRLKPDYAEAHNSLGFAWAQTPGHLDDARAQFEAALRLDPNSVGAHTNLGNVWSETPGRVNDAIAEYEKALRLKPENAEAHYNLGLACLKIPGRLHDAISHFEAVVRLRPDYAPGWHSLGLGWYQMGNLPAAAEAFRQELRLSPDDPMARRALAAVLRQLQHP
ncbi:MAG TPA: tetratricopeptide repeat protein [Opitutaceae bacterium]|nr:tetratricopeptide repeat protein [Opitutaceae bacterium]